MRSSTRSCAASAGEIAGHGNHPGADAGEPGTVRAVTDDEQTAPASDTGETPIADWLGGLARSTGSPGGGAAAAVMLGIAAGLTSMVVGYSSAEGDDEAAALEGLSARAGELRARALQLADEDSVSSAAFGAAFALPKGTEREEAISTASVEAAGSSAAVGDAALGAIDDLEWLAEHGNRALIADVAVACGAARAAITGARTNVSFDLASLAATGSTLDDVRERHPELWSAAQRLDEGLRRIDELSSRFDHRAAPTVHHDTGASD